MSVFFFGHLSEDSLFRIHYPCVGCGEFTTYQYKDMTFCASLTCMTYNNQEEGSLLIKAWSKSLKDKWMGTIADYDIDNKAHVLDVFIAKQLFAMGYYHSHPLSHLELLFR